MAKGGGGGDCGNVHYKNIFGNPFYDFLAIYHLDEEWIASIVRCFGFILLVKMSFEEPTIRRTRSQKYLNAKYQAKKNQGGMTGPKEKMAADLDLLYR